jgi:hypothetical protein
MEIGKTAIPIEGLVIACKVIYQLVYGRVSEVVRADLPNLTLLTMILFGPVVMMVDSKDTMPKQDMRRTYAYGPKLVMAGHQRI